MDQHIQTKAKTLERISDEIKACRACKIHGIGVAVPGEGNPDARIMFLGEAPGKNEAKTGRPFIGRSGQYLRSLIRSIGLSENDVYITSPVKYLPEYGTPTKDDIAHGKTHLAKQLDVIQPEIIVLLGKVATLAALGEELPTMASHGTVREKDGRKYFLTIHPAAAIRFKKFRSVIEGDFQKLVAYTATS